MIEDLEGATSEPGRRQHVLGASIVTVGAVAVLFLALVLAPREIEAPPQASVPQLSSRAVPDTKVASYSKILSTIDQARQRACSYGAGTQWLVVSGIPMDGRPSRLPSVRKAPEPDAAEILAAASQQPTLWMTVTCSPADVVPSGVDLRNVSR